MKKGFVRMDGTAFCQWREELQESQILPYFQTYLMKTVKTTISLNINRWVEDHLYTTYQKQITAAEKRVTAILALIKKLSFAASDRLLFGSNSELTGKILYQSISTNGRCQAINFYLDGEAVETAVCRPGSHIMTGIADITMIENAKHLQIRDTEILMAVNHIHKTETGSMYEEVANAILAIKDLEDILNLIDMLSKVYAEEKEQPLYLLSKMQDAAAALNRTRNAILSGNTVNLSYDGRTVYFQCNNITWDAEFSCREFGDFLFTGMGIGEGSESVRISTREDLRKLIDSFNTVPTECRIESLEQKIIEEYENMDDETKFQMVIGFSED